MDDDRGDEATAAHAFVTHVVGALASASDVSSIEQSQLHM